MFVVRALIGPFDALADRFQELTQAGVPRFPTFVGERIDKSEPEDAVVRVKES
jgi:hypothetical protein